MKKLFFITATAAAIGLGSLSLYAQGMGNGGCGGPGIGPGMGLNHLLILEKELNLTDDQADKIHKADMEFREKEYQLRRDHRNAIDKILTDDQKKKLAEMRKQGPDRGKKGKGKNKDMKAGRYMWPALELTDDQADRIHSINMDYADKFHKNRKNPDELKKLMESREKEIEKVLTKEQIEKFRDFRGKSKGYCPFFPDEE